MEETEKILVPCRHHDEHPLTPINHKKPYRCDGCKTESCGLRYRCEQCNFELHEECTFTSHGTTSHHEFFPGRSFRFFPKPPRSRGCKEKSEASGCAKCLRRCDACGKAVDGFMYHSSYKGNKERELDLHPRCFGLKRSILGGDGVEFLLRDTVDKKCMWCNKIRNSEVRGWSYVSGCGEYHFHVSCLSDLVVDAWTKDSTGDKCLALAELDHHHVLANNRRGKKLRGGYCKKFVRVVRVFVKTFALLLFGFGEPTISLTLLLAELILN